MTIACLFCFFAIVDLALARLLSHVIWLLILGFCAGFLFRPRLKLELQCPNVAFNGQPFELQVVVTNQGRFDAYDLQLELELPQCGLSTHETMKLVGALAPGKSVTVAYCLFPVARGVFNFTRIDVASLFPLSLFKFLSTHHIEKSVYVAPCYTEQNEVLASLVDELVLDKAISSKKNPSVLEYIGSREFRPGVPVRRWDFSSWARIGVPSVREYSECADAVVAIVVDTTRRSKATDEMLEKALSVATGVLMQCVNLRQSTMLITVGKDASFGQILTSPELCEDALIRLAEVEGERARIDWGKAWDEVQSQIPPGATLVAILSDSEAYRTLREQLESHGRVIPYLLSKTDESSPFNLSPDLFSYSK